MGRSTKKYYNPKMVKIIILWMLALTIASISSAQFVNIPDTAFLHALIDDGVDTNADSLISYAEAEAVTSLDVSGVVYCPSRGGRHSTFDGNIFDLTGIEAFINLDSLYIYANRIVSIDLSENNNLRYLNCGVNSLSNLDVSENKTLQTLACDYNQLTSLNVSGCDALTHLYCYGNQLISLDVSKNTALRVLCCYENQLTSLDVSGCTALTYLHCGCSGDYCGTNKFLMSLDISNNIALKELRCGNTGLTSLNVSNNTALEYLDIGKNPNLYQVCVWESYPTAVEVTSTGSPNVYFTTDCATNIKSDYKENSPINIYPNPSNDIINIEIENLNNATLEIYNVSGRLVFSKEINSKVEKIDISGLSEGMYFVKVKQEQNVRIEKVIVY